MDDFITIFCENCGKTLGTIDDNHYYTLNDVVTQKSESAVKTLGPVCRECLKKYVSQEL
jgi:hypothetical protein